MNLFQIINKYNDFTELKKSLKKDYKLQVKQDENLYIINIQKNIINMNPILNLCNGIILEKNTNKLVCNMFPIVKEYPDKYEYTSFNNIVIEEVVDGTLIKLYYYNNKWNIATNRCIDASKAFWISTTSFYDLFMEASNAINLNFESLNKTYCYAFILQHPQNRNVKVYAEPNIVYIYSFDLANNVCVFDSNLSMLQKPKRYNFNSWDELFQNVTKLEYDIEGFIIYNINKEITKIINPKFKAIKDLKGNTPNLMYRSLILFKYGKMDEFLKYFPEYSGHFKYISGFLHNLSEKIYVLYSTRYIKKQSVSVPPHYEIILNHLHSDYIESKIPITKKQIFDKIIGYSPKRIYVFFGTNMKSNNFNLHNSNNIELNPIEDTKMDES